MKQGGEEFSLFFISEKIGVPIWELRENLTTHDYLNYVAYFEAKFEMEEKARKDAEKKVRKPTRKAKPRRR